MDCKLSQRRAALFVYTYRVRYVAVNFNYTGVVSSLKQLSRLLLNSSQSVLLSNPPHLSLMTYILGLWKNFVLTYTLPPTSKKAVLTPSPSLPTHPAPVTHSLNRWRGGNLICQDGTFAFLLLPCLIKIGPCGGTEPLGGPKKGLSFGGGALFPRG